MSRLPHPRFLLFTLILIAATLAVHSAGVALDLSVIVGFDLATLAFVASLVPLWRNDAPDAARARAARDDGGHGFLTLASVAALVAVAIGLGRMIFSGRSLEAREVVLVLATMAMVWLFTNLLFALHYAHVYHAPGGAGRKAGLQFPEGKTDPTFSDFVYFSFVLGMTSQTADVNIADPALRKVAVKQGLLAYVFNLGVLALCINLLAGLI